MRTPLVVLAVCGMACASTEVTLPPLPSTITGLYLGLQDRTQNDIQFDDEGIELNVSHQSDTVSGSWEITTGASGTFFGLVTPSDTAFFFSMDLQQDVPCPGDYMGMAEVRVGRRFDGRVAIAIAGDYEGADCDGDAVAAFFVELQ